MRIMITGSKEIYSIENFYVKYLREAGAIVDHFCAQDMFYKYYQKSLMNKILYRAGLSGILREINKQFRKSVAAFQPDIIWVFKGMEIFPESLQWARDRNIRLVNYNPDNPFVFTGKGSGNSNITTSIGLYHLHFTYNLSIRQKLADEYNARSFFLPFAFDVSADVERQCHLQKEVIALCFLGNPDPLRAVFIMKLAAKGISIDLYGNNWNKFVRHDNVRVFAPVYGKAFWETLYRYRVQLNLMRIHNESSHNMRSFEVPGISGIQLAPDTREHRMFFKNGEEIFLYVNEQDCCEKVQRLLAMTPGEAAVIRKKAHDRCIESGYTYRDKALQAFNALKELANE